MPISEDLLSIIGSDEESSVLTDVIHQYGLGDVYDDPPFRKYVGSSTRGVDVVIEHGRVLAIQIFVQRSDTHEPFVGELPFGLMPGMTDSEVHGLLGEPAIRDAEGSKYTIEGRDISLSVVYGEAGTIGFIDIASGRPA